MKRIFTILLCFGFYISHAQWNISTGSIDWTPDNSTGMPLGYFHHAVPITAAVNITTIGGGTPFNNYPLCSAPLTMLISLSGGASFIGNNASDAVSASGDWESRFSWVYTDGTKIGILATQISTIPSGTTGSANTFTFQVRTPAYSSNFTIGINLQAGAGGSQCNPDTSNPNTSNADDAESTDGFTDRTLPIQKFELNAELIDKTKSKVSWNTLNEVNSLKFDIERKIGKNQNWDMIASVPASGNTTVSKNYNYIDQFNETTERIYYRIKQIDQDGASKYTDIKSIQTRISNIQIDGFPNPVKDQYQLQIYGKKEEKISMDIVDVLGRLVSREEFTIQKGTNAKNLKFGTFIPGTYFIKVTGEDSNESLTVLKVD